MSKYKYLGMVIDWEQESNLIKVSFGRDIIYDGILEQYIKHTGEEHWKYCFMEAVITGIKTGELNSDFEINE